MESVDSETDQIKKLSISESNDEEEDKGEEDESLSSLDIFSADFDPAAAIYCPDMVIFFFFSNENINKIDSENKINIILLYHLTFSFL